MHEPDHTLESDLKRIAFAAEHDPLGFAGGWDRVHAFFLSERARQLEAQRERAAGESPI